MLARRECLLASCWSPFSLDGDGRCGGCQHPSPGRARGRGRVQRGLWGPGLTPARPGDNQGPSALTLQFESVSWHLLQGGPLLAVTELMTKPASSVAPLLRCKVSFHVAAFTGLSAQGLVIHSRGMSTSGHFPLPISKARPGAGAQ